ncbi:hypothetical protein ACO0RG_000246 [Hanseniaspora osmophila]
MDISEHQSSNNHSHPGNNENHHNNSHSNADNKKKISYWVKRIMQPQNTPVSTTTTTTATSTNVVSHPHHRHSTGSTRHTTRKPEPRSSAVGGGGEHRPNTGSSPVKGGSKEKKVREDTADNSGGTTDGKQIDSNRSNKQDIDTTDTGLEVESDRISQNSNQNTIDNSDNFSTTGVISIKTRKSDYSSYTPAPFQKPMAPGLLSQQQTQGQNAYPLQDNGSIKSFTNATITSNSDTINSSIIGIPPASIIDRNKITGNSTTTMSIASQSMINYQPVTNGAASVFSGKVTNHGMTTATTINSSSLNPATPGLSSSSQAGNTAARSRTNTIAEPVMEATTEREEASQRATRASRMTSDVVHNVEK